MNDEQRAKIGKSARQCASLAGDINVLAESSLTGDNKCLFAACGLSEIAGTLFAAADELEELSQGEQ